MNPVLKKLGLTDQSPVLVRNAPEEYRETADQIPGRVDTEADPEVKGKYPFVQAFARNMAEGQAVAAVAVAAVAHTGSLWLCYPKGTSRKYHSDLNRNSAWDLFKPLGFGPVAQVAIDDDWSALRFRPEELIKRQSSK